MKKLIQSIDKLIELSTEAFNDFVVYIGDEDLSDVFDSDANESPAAVDGFVDGLAACAQELEQAGRDLEEAWLYHRDNKSLKHDDINEILNIALSCVDMVVDDMNKVDEEYYASPRADLKDIKLPMPAILKNIQNVSKVLEAVKTEIA